MTAHEPQLDPLKSDSPDETIGGAAPEPLRDRLKGANLYLIGMMGAGKTTVGRVLAKQLGYRFFDTDAVVEQAAGQPIAEIFASAGEPAFRKLETQVLANLSAYKQLVIATGGGIVLDRQNWSYLRHGIVVWLDVPVDVLIERLKGSTTRPLLQDEDPHSRLRSLLDQRQHLYAQADVRVVLPALEPPNRAATRVSGAIGQALKSPLSPPPLDSENMFSEEMF